MDLVESTSAQKYFDKLMTWEELKAICNKMSKAKLKHRVSETLYVFNEKLRKVFKNVSFRIKAA